MDDNLPIENEKVSEVPEPKDVIQVTAPSDELGQQIYKEQALQAKQATVAAQIAVATAEKLRDDPNSSVDQAAVDTAQEAADLAQKRLDVIQVAQGLDPTEVTQETATAIANTISEHQNYVNTWTTNRRKHQLMADTPEAFGHNSADDVWVKQNRDAVAELDAAIAVREGLISQLQAQQAKLHKDK